MKPDAVPALSAPVLAAAGVGTIMATILARAFGGPDFLAVVLIAAAAVLVWSGRDLVPPRLRKTAILLFGVTIVLLPVAREPLAALQRGIFISGLLLAMISSVLLLAQCALKSPRVQQVGAALRGQASNRRYLSFTLSSQIFSGMLGMAGSHIMLVMAAPPQEPHGEEKTEAIIGVTRGFGAAGFWSPVFGNMVTLLALYPTLHWIDIFPVGLALAQVTLIVGALLVLFHNRRHPRPERPAVGRRTTTDLLRDGLPLLLPLLAFMGLLLTTSKLLGIVVSAGVVLLAPLTALVFHLATGATHRRWANVRDNFAETAASYPRLASEALVFMAAGCAGSIMAAAFPPHWAQQIGAALSGLPFFGLAFLLVAIMTMALAGVHPVLSAVFLASTITPDLLGLAPVAHMAALLTGWGLSAILTPFSVLSLTASRYSGISLYQVSIGKNWLFALLSSLCACALLTGVTLAMR
ncbi:MAG TPA: hypothetical protein VIG66_05900 [Noviherbaspirillum sp.]